MGGFGKNGSAEESDRSEGYIAQALTAIKSGDSRNALQFLVAAVDEEALTATYGEAYASVSAELLHHGDFTQAIALLEPASRDPRLSRSPLVWAALGAAYKSADDPKRSKHCFAQSDVAAKEIAQATPPPAAARTDVKATAADRYIELAVYYTEVKRDGRAALLPYRTALKLLPNNPRIMYGLGDLLNAIGSTDVDFNEALALTRAASASAPNNAIYLDAYAWALYNKRNLTAALHVLTEAVADDPDDAQIHYHLGNVFKQMGQSADASREYSRAIILRPGYPQAVAAKRQLELLAPSPQPRANKPVSSQAPRPAIQATPTPR